MRCHCPRRVGTAVELAVETVSHPFGKPAITTSAPARAGGAVERGLVVDVLRRPKPMLARAESG